MIAFGLVVGDREIERSIPVEVGPLDAMITVVLQDDRFDATLSKFDAVVETPR